MKPIIFLLMLFVNGYSYIHLVERLVYSFEDNPIHSKKCSNCKFYIQDNNSDYSRCSKFMKNNKIQITKVDGSADISLKYYLANTCRNNELLCGIDAKQFERKLNDFY
jgi:hypothetical protein